MSVNLLAQSCSEVLIHFFKNLLVCVNLMLDPSLDIRLSSLPEAPAAIDWSYYRSAVAKAGMVDDFEKKVCIFPF